MAVNLQLPEISSKNILVFFIKDDETLSLELMSCYKTWLSSEEQDRMARYYFDKDRRIYLLARALSKSVLAHYLNKDMSALSFILNDYGKPFLKDNELSFNISHSSKLVALAVRKTGLLGVDVECCDRARAALDIANHYFTAAECDYIYQFPEEKRHDAFFQLWTLKESYIKARGKGLSIPLSSFTFRILEKTINVASEDEASSHYWHFRSSSIYENYSFALAWFDENESSAVSLQAYTMVPLKSIESLLIS